MSSRAKNFKVEALRQKAPSLEVDLTWTLRKFPFGRTFSENFSKTLEVFHEFLLKGIGHPCALQQFRGESLFFHIHLCADQKMRTLNGLYRKKNKTTDVLSFPLYANLRGGDEILFPHLELGDVIISFPVMKRQAKIFHLSFEQEFFHLLTHGLLHLLGFDHEISKEEQDIMEGLEEDLVRKIYKKLYEKKRT